MIDECLIIKRIQKEWLNKRVSAEKTLQFNQSGPSSYWGPEKNNPAAPIRQGRPDYCAKLKASNGMDAGLYDNGLKPALYDIIPNHNAEVQNVQKKTPN